MARRRRRTEAEQARRFALLLLPLAGGAGALFLYFGRPRLGTALVAVALAAPSCSLLLPQLWQRLFRAWMHFGERLGRIWTVVLLGLFHVLVFTPIALARRVFGRPALDVAWRDGRSSYWIDKAEVENTLERYRKQH